MLDFNIPHHPAEFYCKLYAVSRTTWWRVSSRSDFPKPLRIGRAVRWSREQVAQYFAKQQKAA